jgi:alkylation response protein AidB-like acyl-CoA dehydrogenase
VIGTTRAGCDPRLGPGLAAVRKGDEYILNGSKAAWVSNGTIATHAILHVGLDSSLGMHGSGIALCPLDLPGISRGRPLNKLGQRALNQGEIVFQDVKLHKKYMLIPVPGIFGDTAFGQTFLGIANSNMGVTFAGLAQACLDEALRFARENEQGGVPLAEHPDVKISIFRMFARVSAARLLARKVSDFFLSRLSGPAHSLASSFTSTYWATGKALQLFFYLYENHESLRGRLQRFLKPDKPGELMEWGKYGVASKLIATETAYEAACQAVRIFGDKALSREYPIEKMMRDARTAMIEDGANDALALASFESL